MIRSVAVFLCVWSAWSFLDETILKYHPYAELGVFAAGVLLLAPWGKVYRHVTRPVGSAIESL